jgi:hypothetical protein
VLIDGSWLRGVEEWKCEAIFPLFIFELDVGVWNAFVLAVPDLQPIDLCHFIEKIQLLDFEMWGLDYGVVPALATLVFEAVDFVDGCTAVGATFISFGSIVMNFQFVVLVSL